MSDLLKINDTNTLYPISSVDVAPAVTKALASIEGMNESFKAFNRSHSDMAWNAMVLDEESNTRNIRQISAEIKRKRDALCESHFKYLKSENRAKHFEEVAKSFKDSSTEYEYNMICSKEKQANAAMMQEAIMGATKDIQALKATYDKLIEAVVKEHGKFDEEIFELEEKAYWIKRAAKQSMQDIRQNGCIGKGEQMLVEQLGIEPLEFQHDIKQYLDHIRKGIEEGKSSGLDAKKQFYEDMAKKYNEKVEYKLSLCAQTKEHLYILPPKDDI